MEADPFVGQRMNCCHHESCGSQRLELVRMELWQLDVVHGVVPSDLCSVTLVSLMAGARQITRSSCDTSAEGV